jgi:hypothetical protein
MKRGALLAFGIFILLCITASLVSAQQVPATVTYYQQPVAVYAAEPTPTWGRAGAYVMAQLGAYGPSDDEHSYDAYEPQTGFAGNLVLGYRFSPYLSLQGEVGYIQSDGEYAVFNFDGLPLMLTMHLGIPVKEFEFYGLAGIGAVFYTVEYQNETGDNVGMGTKIGVGGAYHFTNKFFVGADIAYLMTSIEDAPNDGLVGYINVGYQY